MGVLPLRRIGATGAALAVVSPALAAGIDACGGSLKASGPEDSGAGYSPDYGASSGPGLDVSLSSDERIPCIHIFSSIPGDGGAGATVQGGSPEPGAALWDKVADMVPYDVTLLSCEGAETAHLDSSAQQVLWNYTSNGGRVFASHFHYAWFAPTSAVPSGGPFTTMYSPPLARRGRRGRSSTRAPSGARS